MRSVLIVDDDATNLNVLHSLLKDEYRTLVAINGKKALELARSARPPDVILLDIMMPEMDGYEVCQALKSDPRTRQIPVLFTTGTVDLEGETRGFAVGCADFISKPISPPILMARLKTQMLLLAARQAQLS